MPSPQMAVSACALLLFDHYLPHPPQYCTSMVSLGAIVSLLPWRSDNLRLAVFLIPVFLKTFDRCDVSRVSKFAIEIFVWGSSKKNHQTCLASPVTIFHTRATQRDSSSGQEKEGLWISRVRVVEQCSQRKNGLV